METSAEIAAWGEEWLQRYIDGEGPGDKDPEIRRWVAGHWRSWTLEDWASAPAEERAMFGGLSVDEFNCQVEVGRERAMFQHTRNGLHIWRAFARYREYGLPVPEWVLLQFEDWRIRLERASGATEVAAAIDMSGGKSGPQGASLAKLTQRQMQTVSKVMLLMNHHGLSQSRAIRRVAEDLGETVPAVKGVIARWIRAKTESDERLNALPAHDVLRMLGKDV